eukprot:169346-Prymnesium_polylepis.1
MEERYSATSSRSASVIRSPNEYFQSVFIRLSSRQCIWSTMKGFVPEALVMMSGSSKSASPWRSACAFSRLSSSFFAALPSAESLPAATTLERSAARCASAASCWPGAVYTTFSHQEQDHGPSLSKSPTPLVGDASPTARTAAP